MKRISGPGALSLATFIACGCARPDAVTVDGIDARVASWKGAPVADLIAAMGEPTGRDRGLWTWRLTTAAEPGREPVDCRYFAFVNDGIVTELATLTAVGPCLFAELPSRTHGGAPR